MADPSVLSLGPRTWTSDPGEVPSSSTTSDEYTHTWPSRRRFVARSLILTRGIDPLAAIRYQDSLLGRSNWRGACSLGFGLVALRFCDSGSAFLFRRRRLQRRLVGGVVVEYPSARAAGNDLLIAADFLPGLGTDHDEASQAFLLPRLGDGRF